MKLLRNLLLILLGALGDPRVASNDHARDILFGFRFGLDLYANIRPVRCLDDRLSPLKRQFLRRPLDELARGELPEDYHPPVDRGGHGGSF